MLTQGHDDLNRMLLMRTTAQFDSSTVSFTSLQVGQDQPGSNPSLLASSSIVPSSSSNSLVSSVSMNAQDNDTFASTLKEVITRTVPTFFSYDFSLNIPVIGIMMSHLGFRDAVPATTTMIGTLGFFQFSSVFAAYPALSNLFGKRKAKLQQLRELKQSNDAEDDDDEIVSARYRKFNEEINKLNRQIAITPRNTLIVGAIGEPISIMIMVFANPVLSLLQQKQIVADPSQQFLRYYAIFYAALVPRLAMEFVLLASEKQKQAMVIALMALGATIGTEYSLANQASQGLEGLGSGAGIGVALTCIGFTTYTAYTYRDLFFFRNCLSWDPSDRKQIGEFIRQGSMNVFMTVSDISVSFAASIIAGLLPADALALQNLATQYLNFSFLITASTSQTAVFMVSNKLGLLKSDVCSPQSVSQSIHQTIKAGLVANSLLIMPLAIFVMASPAAFSAVVGISVDETAARNLLLLNVGYSFIDSIRYNILLSTRAFDDYVIPTVASSSALWVGFAGSYVLSQYTSLGVLGIPIGLASGALFGSLFLANRVMNTSIKHAISVNSDQMPAQQVEAKSSGWWCQLFTRGRVQNAPVELQSGAADNDQAAGVVSSGPSRKMCAIL